MNVTSDVTVTGNLVVSGNTSITGPFPIDNLSFNDNIISSTSNADIDFVPGGTGSVNISNLTIDSNLVLKDNNIESKKVVLEIKTNPEKHLSVEFDMKSIFQFQETAIDAVVKLIDRERNSKKTQEQKQAS